MNTSTRNQAVRQHGHWLARGWAALLLSALILPAKSFSQSRDAIAQPKGAAAQLSQAIAESSEALAQSNQTKSAPALVQVDGVVISGHASADEKNSVIKKLTHLAAQKLGQFPDNKLTMDELHQLGDELTLALRKQGYTFDSVYLPPQKISHNTLRFTYVAANLSDIHVINATKFPDGAFLAPLESLKNKALYAPAIENKIHALQKQNGVTVFAFYSRGSRDGDIVLNIKAENKKHEWLSARIENYGSEATGTYHALLDIKGHSLLKTFDDLSLSLLSTQGEGANTYAYLNYRWPFSNLNTALVLGAGDNRYDVGQGFEAINLSGSSRSYSANLVHSYKHFPTHQAAFSVGAYQRKSQLDSDFGEDFFKEESSSAINAETNRHLGSKNNRWRMSGGANLVFGEYQTTSFYQTRIKQDLRKIEYHTSAEFNFFEQTAYATKTKVFVRGQHSFNQNLPGIESISLSGAYGVRAFSPEDFSAHSALLSTFEIHWPRLLNSQREMGVNDFRISPFLFVDRAIGESYSEETKQIKTEISGYGAGVHFAWRRLSGNLTYAQPQQHKKADSTNLDLDPCLKTDSQNQTREVCDAQVLFQLRWQ